jgi:hypothetical protein
MKNPYRHAEAGKVPRAEAGKPSAPRPTSPTSPVSPDAPDAESSRLTRANTEKDLGGITRTRSRGLTEEDLETLKGNSPERVIPEWGAGDGVERSGFAGAWWFPFDLQFCCASFGVEATDMKAK